MHPCVSKLKLGYHCFVALILSLLPLSSCSTPNYTFHLISNITPTPNDASFVYGVTGFVKRDANLRVGPGTDFVVTGSANIEMPITVIGTNVKRDWYLLDNEKWIAASLVDLPIDQISEIPVSSMFLIGSVTKSANLRAGPGTNFAVVGGASPEDLVTIVGMNTGYDWYLLDSGKWIAAFLVTITTGQRSHIPVASIPEQENFVKATLKKAQDTFSSQEEEMSSEQQERINTRESEQETWYETYDQREQTRNQIKALELDIQSLEDSKDQVTAADAADGLRIEQIEQDINKAKQSLADAEQEYSLLKNQLDSAQEKLDALDNEITRGEQKLRNVKAQHSEERRRLKAIQSNFMSRPTIENFRAVTSIDMEEEIPLPPIPQFDLPPPRTSASIIVPFDRLHTDNTTIYLSDIDRIIINALEGGGYAEKSYYSVPDGFAIVTRLEQIHDDGTPLDGPDRWSTEVAPLRDFSITKYFKALFSAPRGYFRIIVFVVTPHPFSQTTASVSRSEAINWLFEGITNKLPHSIGEREYTSMYTSTALIYQFEQKGHEGNVGLQIDGVPTGRQHLERSNLWFALSQ